MADWTPDTTDWQRPLYRALADALADDIEAGRLLPGERLPTHRELASRLGISIGTVPRGYQEAEERGSIESTPGRGSFVRQWYGEQTVVGTGLTPDDSIVDLSLAHPHYAQDPDLKKAFRSLARRSNLQSLLRYQSVNEVPRYVAAGSQWLERYGVPVGRDQPVITAGAQHALFVLLSSVAAPGDLLLTDELTYPGFLSAATQLGLRIRSVRGDEEGILPDALRELCQAERPRALYVIPTIHNPTGFVMGSRRRERLAELAAENDVLIIEDDTLRLLEPDPPPPITTFHPDGSFFIGSMSKSVAGGLRIAFVHVPLAFRERVEIALSATVFMVSPITVALSVACIEDGTAHEVVERKRAEAEARQELAARILGRFPHRTHPQGYYFWLELPELWTSAEFASEARRRGVGATPSRPFVAEGSASPPGVRICLSAADDRQRLETALRTLAEIVESPGLGSARLV